ncbi:SGNH/GDSL hydrolase family protein [Actinocorallia sp. API 0066]|nr:SGNH/GDSL hydrolase family protein [Actinocorallia sp. API 0066]MCD0447845.1 SGNH/GDSL hydrolase family protein [Actinocorallia sp. API 0066]
MSEHMLRALTTRRIVAAAAFGGGGLTVLGGLTFALLVAEAKAARKIIQGSAALLPPVTDGLYGGHLPGAPLSFAMLGDSTAAGIGVVEPDETAAGLLAAGLSASAGRPVRLTNVAVSGSRSEALEEQVAKALEAEPEVAVIMIGANDVTARVPAAESVRHLERAVSRLTAAGARVVVGTCPDLGSVEPLLQPLRWIAQRTSRQLAAAQTVVVVRAGGRTVSLGDLLGRDFASEPREFFSADRYHPSARGYGAAAAALLPSVTAALDLEPEDRFAEGVLPLYLAAASAAEKPGTEVAARGDGAPRWVTLLRRRGTAPVRPRATPAVPEVAPGMA